MSLLQDAMNELKKLQDFGDNEIAHAKADKVLCELLSQLGYGEVVTEYDKIGKWYA